MTYTHRHIIAADQRLSQSLLWEIQRRYFLRNGMKAWQNDEVPHDISSNPVGEGVCPGCFGLFA
ncbi:MAG: hypothetical protein GY803_02270 [Chloroflexi bacterium]|nr:hypothetical protein [Chloroflexota bacterium]